MRRALVLIAALLVVAFYFTGRADPLLYKVGLNYGTCGQNAFGAVFCGDQLTQYQDHLKALTP